MTDLRQAAMLALKALENSWTEPGNKQYELEKEAIHALRTALEQQAERWCMKANGCKTECGNCPNFPSPQRQWVGLTDEDMKDPKTHILDFIYGARWAEAKLKEKNT